MIRSKFEQENDQLLKFILDKRFFEPWAERGTNPNMEKQFSLSSEGYLEIYITSHCNYKCEYCYLRENCNIYPTEVDKPELIISNLKLLCSYLIQNEYCIPDIELFSGEIWHTNFGREILEILYQACLNGLQCKHFLIPSNCTFANDDAALHLIQRFIDKFEKIGVVLQFSISMDGKIIDNYNRPSNDQSKERNDLFYDNIFLFAHRNGFTFHPMVAAYTIEQWKENFQWWKEMCIKNEYDVIHDVMLLEVRNNDWTEEKIQSYCDFLEFIFLNQLEDEKIKNKRGHFVNVLLGRDLSTDEVAGGYLPYYLVPAKTFASCTISNNLTVRLGDLAICPCHRTAYKELLYGYFQVENGSITGIISNNIYNAVHLLLGNEHVCHIKCDSCIYAPFCIRNCYGAQFETNNDMFLPVESVCKFFEAKYKKICQLYEEHGIIDRLQEILPTDLYFPNAQKILNFIKGVKENASLPKKKEERIYC